MENTFWDRKYEAAPPQKKRESERGEDVDDDDTL